MVDCVICDTVHHVRLNGRPDLSPQNDIQDAPGGLESAIALTSMHLMIHSLVHRNPLSRTGIIAADPGIPLPELSPGHMTRSRCTIVMYLYLVASFISIAISIIQSYISLAMSSRPDFIAELIRRPLPALTPPRLTDKSNPPFSVHLQNQIADLKCHPLLESAVSVWRSSKAELIIAPSHERRFILGAFLTEKDARG